MHTKFDIKQLFLLIFISGSVLIMLGAFFHYELLVLFLILMFMSSYFFFGSYLVKSSSVSKEQFADSNYYLGFLFTLVSLSSSLIWIALEESYLNNLIELFGVALISTVFGLFVRIYIINFVPNTKTNLDNFDAIISDKLYLINNLISESVNKNRLFTTILDEKITSYNANTQKTLDAFSKNLTKSLTLSVQELESTIHDINGKVAKAYKEQAKEIKQMSKEVEKKHNEFLAEVDKTKNSINNEKP